MRVILLLFFAAHLFAATYTIRFIGNATFSAKRLYEELGFTRSWKDRILRRPFKPQVDEKLLPTLQEELEYFYQEQGFLDARVDVLLQENTALFRIYEGKPVIVREVSVTSDFAIKPPFQKGERFIIPKFTAFKKAIKKELLAAGYCSADFNPKAYIYKKTDAAYISIYLKKGKPCTIGKIDVHNLSRLDERIIRSHIFLHEGDEFNLTKIEESYKKLYSLEYFDQVRFDYSKKIQNRVLLDIFLKERQKRNIYRAGLGYETDRGAIVSFRYRHLNFHTHQITLNLSYSGIKKEASLSVFTPSVRIGPLMLDMVNTFGYYYDTFDSFTSRKTTYTLKFLRDYYDISWAAALHFERDRIASKSSCIPSHTYELIYPSLRILFDRRDSKIFPTQGYYLLGSIESSLKLFSSSDYIKTVTEGGIYLPLAGGDLFAKLKAGFITHSGALPPTKLFVAGGARSNRAYGYRTIYALDSKCQIGGKNLLESTLEYRYPVKNFYVAAFWDRSYVTRKWSLSHYRDGVGIGVLYPTPIGTLKAYFGLDPKDLGQNLLSLYIGATF